jgi:solute carrier family 13 (sodium-dependent dicarboxylate transporter), member 2/3/5
MTRLLRFLSGPIVFLLLYTLPYEGVAAGGRGALAVFGWMITWWTMQPVPWAIASLLPLIVFPVLNVKDINGTAALYGQTIFFWIWGTVLLGHAMTRHGLARRFALWFLSQRWIGVNSGRIAFGFMLITGLISTVISDAATVAMMIPVSISVTAFVRTVQPNTPARSNFGAFLSLGALYAAVAGGCATIAGIPHNALSMALLERATGHSIGWLNWMAAGTPVFVASLFLFYFILRLFLPPEFDEMPGGAGFIRKELAKLGPMSAGEKATLFVFSVMVFLFVLPSLLTFTLGAQHPVAALSSRALNLNVVPPIILLLLFVTPVEWAKGEFVLSWKDALAHSPWDIMLLATAAAGVVNALGEFKFIDLVGNAVGGIGLTSSSLPFVAAITVALSANFMTGIPATAFFGGIFIPAAQHVGFNPVSMAILVPNVAVGFAFPWAGAVAGTAFATGEIEIKQMIRVGLIATVAFAVLVAAVHAALARFI